MASGRVAGGRARVGARDEGAARDPRRLGCGRRRGMKAGARRPQERVPSQRARKPRAHRALPRVACRWRLAPGTAIGPGAQGGGAGTADPRALGLRWSEGTGDREGRPKVKRRRNVPVASPSPSRLSPPDEQRVFPSSGVILPIFQIEAGFVPPGGGCPGCGSLGPGPAGWRGAVGGPSRGCGPSGDGAPPGVHPGDTRWWGGGCESQRPGRPGPRDLLVPSSRGSPGIPEALQSRPQKAPECWFRVGCFIWAAAWHSAKPGVWPHRSGLCRQPTAQPRASFLPGEGRTFGAQCVEVQTSAI